MELQPSRFLTPILLIHGFIVLAGCGNEIATSPVARPSTTIESEDPGRLRTIMVHLGEDMNAVSRGLWLEDLAAVAIAATAIAEHPHVSNTERRRIQAALGDEFSEFAKSDKRVHSAAVRLSVAARADDLNATLEELTRLQAACAACHSDHRESLR